MIFVDSSVWIAYFNGVIVPETDLLDHSLSKTTVAIGDLVLTEVLQGFRHQKDYEIAKQLLTSLTTFELLGEKQAIKSAENYRFLRSKGITVRKTVDVIIAKFCIEKNIPLLHLDKDFLPFTKHLGLRTP